MSDQKASIQIERVYPPGKDDPNKIQLHGKFNIVYGEDSPLARGADILKHIILVVTRTSNYQAVTPFKDVIVFEDDIVDSEQECSGVFNIDVFNKIQFDGEGDYYILCSIGSVTSNVLRITI